MLEPIIYACAIQFVTKWPHGYEPPVAEFPRVLHFRHTWAPVCLCTAKPRLAYFVLRKVYITLHFGKLLIKLKQISLLVA